MTRGLALSFLLLVLSLGGCNAKKSLEKREAERIVAAIERIGTVSAAEREPLIVALENEKVESPRVEKLRVECAAAYRALHTAQIGLSRTAGGDPFAAADHLKAANAQIAEAKAAHDRCNQALADLRQALGAK